MRNHALPTLFDRYFETAPTPAASSVRETYRPAVDLIETETSFELTLDVPGVGEAGVDVQFADGILEIRGERPGEPPAEGTRTLRRERASGAFFRRVAFRDDVDVDAISAEVKDGVLRVRVPKVERVQPRQIPVTVN